LFGESEDCNASTHRSRGAEAGRSQLYIGRPRERRRHLREGLDDPVGVTFWKVQNGIRLTGMPGFKAALSASSPAKPR
jgi:hypothetical protein